MKAQTHSQLKAQVTKRTDTRVYGDHMSRVAADVRQTNVSYKAACGLAWQALTVNAER